MTDRDKSQRPMSGEWTGLRELDQAVADDRLTAYTWKKAWADPWGRVKLFTVFLGLAAFAVFVIVQDVFL